MRDYTTISKRLRMYSENCVAYKLDADFANAVTAAADAIEELLAELVTTRNQLPKWISVEERLPEEYKDVLCYCEYFRYGDYNCMFRAIDRGYYGNGRWGGEAGQGHKNKVLAWMPLPTPPKEVQDNG